MYVEILFFLILLVLIYIAKHVSRPDKSKEDVAVFGQVMGELGVIKKGLEVRSEKEREEKEQKEKEIKEHNKKVSDTLNEIFRVMVGTSKRGSAGEQQLKNILSVPIKLGIIKTNLPVGTTRVEFAWELDDGKFIPIDSKLPEAEGLYKDFEEEKDPNKQKKIKKKIADLVKKHALVATKYKNKANTIDRVIVAVPDSFSDVIPDINAHFKKTGILVCGYSYVFFFGYYLSEIYSKTQETGDSGPLLQSIDDLLSIIRDIENGTIRIDKGIRMIEKANMEIKKQVFGAEKHKLKKKKIPIAVES